MPDDSAQMEFHKRSTTCSKEPYKSTDFTKLTVDGTCHNFVKDGKTVYYKAIKTTDTSARKPRKKDDLSKEAVCTSNKVSNDKVASNNGLRCINMPDGSGPKICKNVGFEGGTYTFAKRPSAENAENSNLCKSTCIDRGDVFCVSKKDLTSFPACCPKECEEGGDNVCSKALKSIGDYVCSDQITLARDEMKYLLCPPNKEMQPTCGTKFIKFDSVKDKSATKTFSAPWYPAGSLDAPAF